MENIKILKQEPIFPDTQTWFGDCHANTQHQRKNLSKRFERFWINMV